jgi:hypothetical protein
MIKLAQEAIKKRTGDQCHLVQKDDVVCFVELNTGCVDGYYRNLTSKDDVIGLIGTLTEQYPNSFWVVVNGSVKNRSDDSTVGTLFHRDEPNVEMLSVLPVNGEHIARLTIASADIVLVD